MPIVYRPSAVSQKQPHNSCTSSAMRCCLADKIVPLKIDFTASTGHRVKDSFVWRADAPENAVDTFATLFCTEQGLADPADKQQVVQQIAQQAQRYLETLNSVLASSDVNEPRVETISFNVVVGDKMLNDTLDWDVHNQEADVGAYARQLCKDMKLPNDACSAVECELLDKVYEQLRTARATNSAQAAEGANEEKTADDERLQKLAEPFGGHAVKLQSVYTSGVVRKREDWTTYTPTLLELTPQEQAELRGPTKPKIKLRRRGSQGTLPGSQGPSQDPSGQQQQQADGTQGAGTNARQPGRGSRGSLNGTGAAVGTAGDLDSWTKQSRQTTQDAQNPQLERDAGYQAGAQASQQREEQTNWLQNLAAHW